MHKFFPFSIGPRQRKMIWQEWLVWCTYREKFELNKNWSECSKITPIIEVFTSFHEKSKLNPSKGLCLSQGQGLQNTL